MRDQTEETFYLVRYALGEGVIAEVRGFESHSCKGWVSGTTTTENIMKQLLETIKAKFEARLQEKTGWGRNEVIQAYNDCVTEALMEQLG